MNRLIKVLVVDDSAYVRKVLRQILLRNPFIEVVGSAHDGKEALELTAELNPDVIVLDLIMPVMDGISFLKEQMARRPVPVVILSIESELGEMSLAALDAGAIDFLQKPTALATDRILEIGDELIDTVKAAAAATPIYRGPAPEMTELPASRSILPGKVDVVLIGISTGGPQALRFLIPQFPADLPVPIAVVLHMPVGYTEMYARKLDEVSRVEVVEAGEGELVKPGRMLLAPAGRHMTFIRSATGEVAVHLDARPFDTLHRPSVDELFRSAAEVYGSKALAVVMTGMGSDGKAGSAWIKAKGGTVYTEAEETCVVYGMPRSVFEAGLSDRVVPLDLMARAIVETI
ncbi:MAG: chemotaxis response regulator protein-glutamate methylesterase [Syntrophobacteraceae bacterium]